MDYMLDPAVAGEDDLTPDYMRTQDHGIVLYPAQFECGLRLPLDPFIVDFIEFHHILPGDLPPNSVRVLVTFAAVLRLLGFEPSLQAFDLWYFTQVSGGKFSIKRRIWTPPPIFTDAKNKHDSWFCFPIFVENRLGWPFCRPVGPIVKTTEKLDNCDEANFIKKKIDAYLGAETKKGGHALFEIDWILGDEKMLIRSGVAPRRPYLDVSPRVPMAELLRDPDWRVHHNFEFSYNCTICAEDQPRCPPPDFFGL